MCLFCEPANSSRLRYRAAGRTVAERLAGTADIILRGGDIRTMDDRAPRAGALSVRDGLVQSVGSLDAVLAFKGRSTRIVDVAGATIIPGMVLAAFPKDPVALLDWQEIDLAVAGGDLGGYLSRTVAPPLFSAPVFIRTVDGGGTGEGGGLLAALESLCGMAPIAVRFGGSDAGLANRAMLRLAAEAAGTEIGGIGPFVADIAALLGPFASKTMHSASALRRVLENATTQARAAGYTMVVDRAMGALAGRGEMDAAAALFAAGRRVRMRAVAHRRLREEWDGRLPEQVRPDMLGVDAALLEGGQPADELLSEAASLSKAGWRLVFSAGSRNELEAIADVCRALGPVAGEGKADIELRFASDEADAELMRGLGIRPVDQCDAGSGRADAPGGAACDLSDIDRHLAAVTREAARDCGLDQVAGSIARGRYADFTLLDRPPSNGIPPAVAGTWVDGIPAS